MWRKNKLQISSVSIKDQLSLISIYYFLCQVLASEELSNAQEKAFAGIVMYKS